MLVVRAECQRYLGAPLLAAQDLDLAEELVADESKGGLILANVHGGRGLLALEAGLVDVAAGHFAHQRRQVDRALDPGQAPPIEWFFANRSEARLLLAQDDFVTLVARVDAWLDEPVYQHPSTAGHAANLRALQAFGLDELEENDPERVRRAADLLAGSLAELTPLERPRALLTLCDIALRQGDLAGAGTRLDEVAGLLAASESAPDADVHRERLFWTALSARHARLAGRPLEPWVERLAAQHARFVNRAAALPLRPGGYGPLHYLTSLTLLSELFELTLRLEPEDVAVERALAAFFEVSAVGTLARVLDAPVSTVDAIRRELLRDEGPPGTTPSAYPVHGLLIYVPTHWTTHLFLVDRDQLRHFRLPRDDVLEAARADLVRSFRQPRTSEHLAAEGELRSALAELLLPPEVLEATSHWSRWTVVGTEVLGELPFEMLPRGDDPFLGAVVAIDRLPSVPVGLALARRDPGAPADRAARDHTTGVAARLLAAPSASDAARRLSPELPELVLREPEAARILAAYGPGRVEQLLGPRARMAAITAAGSERARVWQFLVHGVYDATRERPNALALAPDEPGDDGLLWAGEIERLDPAELVVLTACRAGMAPRRRGDPGAADLGGAFLVAGAEAVVLSSFDLELQAVLRLSATFHAALVQGASPAEAMRRARAELITDPRFADPLLFGTLHVVGLGQRAIFPAPPPEPSGMPWWAAGLLLATGWAALVLVRRLRRAA